MAISEEDPTGNIVKGDSIKGSVESGTGKSAVSSVNGGYFQGIDISPEELAKNKSIATGEPLACEKNSRSHPQAYFTVHFENHPRFGNQVKNLCPICWDQEKHNPEYIKKFDRIGSDVASYNRARVEKKLREIAQKNSSSEQLFVATGEHKPVRTQGRPQKVETAGSLDKELQKDYGKLAPDHVSPVIERAAAEGGRDTNNYDNMIDMDDLYNDYEDENYEDLMK